MKEMGRRKPEEEEMTRLWGKTRCLRHHPKGLGRLYRKNFHTKNPSNALFWDLTGTRSIFIASAASYTSLNVHDA
jgi:hypothetical protein